MKRRSLLTLAGLGLLAPGALSACSSDSANTSQPSGSGATVLDVLRVHTPTVNQDRKSVV